jgi:choline dehydrogenase
LGIETKVNLPSVGENLIEQPNLSMGYTVAGDLSDSCSACHAFFTAADLFGEDLSEIEDSTRANLQTWAQTAVDGSGGALNLTAVEQQFRLQHDLIFKRNVTAAEIITASPPGSGILASNFWILLPFSRGSVHLSSADNINTPVLDPRLFWVDFDVTASVATGRLARKFWTSEPASKYVGDNIFPGPDVLPDNAEEVNWVLFTHGFCEWHRP